MKSKKILTLGFAVAMAAIMVLSGTYAWFVATDTKINHLKTDDSPVSDVEIFEIFDEPDDWKPGQEITKNVGVINTGTAPALVRISFKEALKLSRAYAASATVYDPASTAIPQLYDAGAVSGWDTLSTTALSGSSIAALNGFKLDKVYPNLTVKAYAVTTGTGSAARTTYSIVAYSPIASGDYSGKNQRVTFDFAVDDATKTVSLTNIQYYAAADRDSYAADWATDKPAAAAILKSVAEAKANTAHPGDYPGYIELSYDSLAAAITPANWFYNANDGYFYYIGSVEPGTASANLLKSLTLNKNADSKYANLDMDLVVVMDAIQNTSDALTSVWSLDPTADAALIAALGAYCE